MNDQDFISSLIVGDFIRSFTCGECSWEFQFNEFEYLFIAAAVSSPDEALLNELYEKKYSLVNKSIDKELVAQSTIIASCLRQKITDVKLSEDSILTMYFENKIQISFPSTVEIIDWQWAFTIDGKIPYTTKDYKIACFGEKQIEYGQHS